MLHKSLLPSWFIQQVCSSAIPWALILLLIDSTFFLSECVSTSAHNYEPYRCENVKQSPIMPILNWLYPMGYWQIWSFFHGNDTYFGKLASKKSHFCHFCEQVYHNWSISHGTWPILVYFPHSFSHGKYAIFGSLYKSPFSLLNRWTMTTAYTVTGQFNVSWVQLIDW